MAGNVYIPSLKTTRYGLKSIESWKYLTKHFKDINLSDLSRKKFKKLVTLSGLIFAGIKFRSLEIF